MSWKNHIGVKLNEALGKNIIIENYSPVGGGSINEAYKIDTSDGLYFVKKNSARLFPQMFQKEIKGINIIGKTNEIIVPQIVCSGEIDNVTFLIMKHIQSGITGHNFWDDFGKKLASLHKYTDDFFGLDHDNYIGSLIQRNNKHDNWYDFFREERLEFQVKMARNNGQAGVDIVKGFERFYGRLESIFPKEPPALLHGDLWSGNYMINENGEPVLIDPAVYFGHREMDLAMTKLFGGFDKQFYQGYNKQYPLEKGWESRMEYCNLYPLMVHVNLFGGSYLQSVKSIIRRF